MSHTRAIPLPHRSSVRADAVALATTALMLAAGACRHRPETNGKPPMAIPERFSGADGTGAELPQRWWTSFGDSDLNRLVDQALASNSQIHIAWARLHQAEAGFDSARASWFPVVTAGVDTQGNRRVLRGPFGPNGTDENVVLQQLLYTGSVGASYEIDLWGKLSSQRAAAALDAAATRSQLDSVAMTVAAQVTDTFLAVVSQRAQLALLRKQLELNQALAALMAERFKQGLSPSFEALQQQQQVSAVRAQVAFSEGQVEMLAQRLAILVGQPPEALVQIGRERLPALPPLPGAGLPIDLLGRRPDVVAARLRVQAADYRVGAALAERFPSLMLNGTIGYAASALSSPYNLIWNFLIGLTETVFDGGRRAAKISQSRAVLDEQLAQYRDVLLQALLEVENALVQEKKQSEQNGYLREQLDQADLALEQVRTSYVEGLAGYLSVLTALVGKQRVELELLAGQRELLANRVALFRALGGTWTTDLEDPGRPSRRGEERPAAAAQPTDRTTIKTSERP